MFGVKKGKVMESYFDIVKKCADNKENFPIPNRDAKHAAYIIKLLFKNAESNVNIFTGTLFSGVYGNEDLIKEAVKFLTKPNTQLKIAFQNIVERDAINNNDFIKQLKENFTAIVEKIKLYDASKISQKIPFNHFCVIDNNKAFRFEYDHKSRKAVANFGDPKTAEKLSQAFTEILKHSIEIPIEC